RRALHATGTPGRAPAGNERILAGPCVLTLQWHGGDLLQMTPRGGQSPKFTGSDSGLGARIVAAHHAHRFLVRISAQRLYQPLQLPQPGVEPFDLLGDERVDRLIDEPNRESRDS